MHVHTSHSPDGAVRPRKILKVARSRGLAGVAVVDHNVTSGARAMARIVGERGGPFPEMVVVRGVEVSTAEGHLIGLGLREAPPRGKGALETAEALRDMGGIVVVPHFGR